MTDITYLTAAETGRRIATRDLDARDVTEAYLGAIEASPFANRIYARVTAEAARTEAASAADRASRGVLRGPLDGVPISWKDLYDTAGVATEAGSAMIAGRVPDRDATVVARGRRAGVVSLGKTHMTELAFSGLGLNPVTETPPNFVDHALVPGGSSSGAAASIAFGLAAAGIGSDTGGSVRIPACWNDLVGLKTTHGLIPADGVVLLIESFDTIGPLARSVEDLALLTAMMADQAAPDLSGASLKGVKLLVAEGLPLDGECEDAPRAAFEASLAPLKDAGAEIHRAEIPEIDEAMAISLPLYVGEAWAEWGAVIREKGDLMYPPVRERFESGDGITLEHYWGAWRELKAIRQRYLARVAGYDAVLMPTSPILPPDRERLLTDDAYFTAKNLLALRNTRIGNLLGLCSLTLPTDTPMCGLNLMAAPFEEAKLLRLGAAIEAL
ncbi:MAG: amidase [Pseudomonadota bacterium]